MKDTLLQWYRIEDKQPEVGEIVFVKEEGGGFYVMQYSCYGKSDGYGEPGETCFLLYDPLVSEYSSQHTSHIVTHWAYLPEVGDEL